MRLCASVHPFIAPEEQRNRAGAGMAADGGADAVYQNLAVKVRERGLNLVRNVARIVHAGGFGNIALAGIIKPVFGMLLQLLR